MSFPVPVTGLVFISGKLHGDVKLSLSSNQDFLKKPFSKSLDYYSKKVLKSHFSEEKSTWGGGRERRGMKSLSRMNELCITCTCTSMKRFGGKIKPSNLNKG